METEDDWRSRHRAERRRQDQHDALNMILDIADALDLTAPKLAGELREAMRLIEER